MQASFRNQGKGTSKFINYLSFYKLLSDCNCNIVLIYIASEVNFNDFN